MMMGKGMTEANHMQHVSVECGNVEGMVDLFFSHE
jgi:hypothetical protein